VGTPFEIYTAPKTEFVANFIGESTVLVGEVKGQSFNGDGLNINNLSQTINNTNSAKLIIRPEALSLITGKSQCGEVEIKEVIFAGDALEVLLLTSTGREVKVKSDVSLLSRLVIGEKIELFVDVDQIGQLV